MILKLFLFMFPLKEYVDALVGIDGHPEIPFDPRCDPHYMNCLIQTRYRDEGYRVAWLFFSESEGTSFTARSCPYIWINPEDMALKSDQSFEGSLYGYRTRPGLVFDQVGGRIDDLVIGGYHMWSCVDGMAAYAHFVLGIPTRVDEDLTEFFVSRMMIEDPIPLKRLGPTLKKLDSVELWCARKARKPRPWLEQV